LEDVKKTFRELDFRSQEVYYKQAEYLISKGLMSGDPELIAEKIYNGRKK